MNYIKHYDRLINRAKNRCIIKSEYKEIHHIIPKCMGGDDSKENLVELFPEEHLLAHLLLVKIYSRNHKLVYAANLMTNIFNKNRINNKKYAWLKKKFNKINSEKTPELRAMYSNRMKEFNKTYKATTDTKNKIAATIKEKWKMDDFRKEKHSKRIRYENNPNFDTTLYEFEHKDGRIIICHQCVLRNKFGCDKVDAIINGHRKTSQGWRFTGHKYKRIEI